MVEPHGTLFGKPAWLVLISDYDQSDLGLKWCCDHLAYNEWIWQRPNIFYFTDKKQAVYFKLTFGGQCEES